MLKDQRGLTSFSILERIELGETALQDVLNVQRHELSVSSNGSNWVKLPE